MDIQDVIYARAALKFWGVDVSGLSDDEAVKLYWREFARRLKVVSKAARVASKSIRQLARSFQVFHRASLKAVRSAQV